VCAFTGATGEWLFESDYVISSKCVVSELDWRSPGGRPDVRGVFQWLDEPGTRKPAKLPFALGEQCQTTFSDAAFCSPTLVVMPTQNPDVYDACGLQTHLKGFNPIVVNIVRGQSRWVCETKDLRVVNKQERLSVHEWDCVPNLRGNISSMCKLPYLPTTKSVRYRDLHDDNVPINP
jgi:hypothetical protein